MRARVCITSCMLIFAAGTACAGADATAAPAANKTGWYAVDGESRAAICAEAARRPALRKNAGHAAVYCATTDCTGAMSTAPQPAFHFSRAMNSATFNDKTFSLTGPDGAKVSGTPSYAGGNATFVPAAGLAADTTYTLSLTTGVLDSLGNPLARNYVCIFSTGPAAVIAPQAAMPATPVAAEVPAKPLELAAIEMTPAPARPWYVAPMIIFAFPTCNGCIQRGAGWRLGLGKEMSEHWNLELSVVDRNLDLKRSPGSSRDTSYGVDALWFPDRSMPLAPFLLLGSGAHHQEQDPNRNSTVPYATAGAGFLLTPQKWNPAIRAGAQWIRPFGGNYCGKGDTTVGLGLQFHFGG